MDVSVQVNEALPYRVKEQPRSTVSAGETAELQILLVPGARVRGAVVDDSSQPIAGVRLWLSDNTAYGRMVTTGEDGHYEATLAPGQINANMRHVPRPYLAPVDSHRFEKVAAGSNEIEFQPFTLRRGVSRSGIVVDEQDRPVAGASLHGTWRNQEGTLSTLGGSSAISDENGEFLLGPVPSDTPLGITATTPSRATAQMVEVQPAHDTPKRIKVTPQGMVTVAGRVLDRSGNPAAAAKIQFMAISRLTTGERYGQYPVMFDTGREILTDEKAGSSYRLEP